MRQALKGLFLYATSDHGVNEMFVSRKDLAKFFWVSGPMAHFSFLVDRMRQTLESLRQMLEPVVEAMGYELVGVEFHPRGVNALLRIYIDAESGISLDDCQQVSHQISGLLDVEDPIPNRYTFEVSSPGLHRPLFKSEHFIRFIGRRVRIHLSIPREGRKNFIGRLLGMRGENVVLEIEGKELLMPLESIEKARLVPDF
jgi:ribosome maturation factor RimP